MWIGLNDIEQEDIFTWEVDNSNVDFSKWRPEQPDNDNNQDCVTVGANQMFGLWEDYQCDKSHLYMCEKPTSGTRKDVSCELQNYVSDRVDYIKGGHSELF